jgi:hypothetical protein
MSLVVPACGFCAVPMTLRRVHPKTWIFPEVRAYECHYCGDAISVECDTPRIRHEAPVASDPRLHG